MSLIAAGILMAVSAAAGTASAIEQRKDDKKDEKDGKRIAAAENANAKYAGELEQRRVDQAKAYEPGIAAIALEADKKPVLAEEAIPLTGSLIAAQDILQEQPQPAADMTGTAPGSVRKQAIDLSGNAVTAGQIVGQSQQLKTALELEDFTKRKSAIDAGKVYVGS